MSQSITRSGVFPAPALKGSAKFDSLRAHDKFSEAAQEARSANMPNGLLVIPMDILSYVA